MPKTKDARGAGASEDMKYSFSENTIINYIDASVLLENNQWRIFHDLTSEDIDDVMYCFLHWIYIIKRKLHGGLEIFNNLIIEVFTHIE